MPFGDKGKRINEMKKGERVDAVWGQGREKIYVK